ncbi:MAG: tRNA (adenosine(37)-N6)-dimethylallyltransferase MiaA [Bacteroidota bacterium]
MTDVLPSLVVVTGPTAIGKTRLAIALAKTFSTEIISCDSRQFYQELNIGVARPSVAELGAIPHHMIGFLSVRDSYNAYRYENDVLGLCRTLFQSTNRIVMAGGSGLYIYAVTHGIDELPDPDPTVRFELKEKLRTEGIEALQLQLKKVDPAYFQVVDKDNPKRLLRALEVCLTTDRPYSSLRTGQPVQRFFRTIRIGLMTDREKLYERINRRVDQMIENGLLDEVQSLLPYKDLNALNTVGYKELFAYLEGHYSFEDAVEKIKIHTRRYAKRQLTWFKKDPDIRWFEPEDREGIMEYVDSIR